MEREQFSDSRTQADMFTGFFLRSIHSIVLTKAQNEKNIEKEVLVAHKCHLKNTNLLK